MTHKLPARNEIPGGSQQSVFVCESVMEVRNAFLCVQEEDGK